MSSDVKNSIAQFFFKVDQRNQEYSPLVISNVNLTNVDIAGDPPFIEQDDSWSIIWYIASFSGLIAFFLIVSCSEWCCRMHIRAPSSSSNHSRPLGQSSGTQTPSSGVVDATMEAIESPPPAYDLFAPPSYDSLSPGAAGSGPSKEKSEFDVYVVPVHAIRIMQDDVSTTTHDDHPPSYISVQMNTSS